MMRAVRSLTVGLVVLALAFGWVGVARAIDRVDTLIEEMMTAFTRGGKGVNGEDFKARVNELDEELRQRLEKDHDLKPFEKLLAAAGEFSARKAARQMFAVALERAAKRLQFTKAQQEIKDTAVLERIDEMKGKIDQYLDPNKPDEDTVDRKSLEQKRAKLQERVRAVYASLVKIPAKEKYVVNVTDEKGEPGKLPAGIEKSLLGKIKSLTESARQIRIDVKLRRDEALDCKVLVHDYTTPAGFGVVEAELEFAGIGLAALKDESPTAYAGVLDDSTFVRYRVVQTEEQLNTLPGGGETAYEMGALQPGESWKLEFKKPDAIDAVMKELQGDDRFEILNGQKAKQQKCIEIKNQGAKDLIYLQGTDKGGLCSVKALGYLKASEGTTSFKEVLLVVDDQLASDLGKFIGGQGINFFLKAAFEQTRKGYPFTPVLDQLQFDRDGAGKQVFIFTGRGPQGS